MYIYIHIKINKLISKILIHRERRDYIYIYRERERGQVLVTQVVSNDLWSWKVFSRQALFCFLLCSVCPCTCWCFDEVWVPSHNNDKFDCVSISNKVGKVVEIPPRQATWCEFIHMASILFLLLLLQKNK